MTRFSFEMQYLLDEFMESKLTFDEVSNKAIKIDN